MPVLETLKKRDLARLRSEIADLAVGDQVRLHLRDKDRYGDLVVTGEVYRNMFSELCVCGFVVVDAKGKPSAMLMAFDDGLSDPQGRMSGTIEHGQVVRVQVAPAGADRGGIVTGAALMGQSDSLTIVGGFIVGGRRCLGVLVTDERVEGVRLRTAATEIE